MRGDLTQGGCELPFFVKGTDTSGTVSLRRDNATAAVKKAKELLDDGSWDVEITGPDGLPHPIAEFEAMQSVSATAPAR
jgi:hypothetical protein